MPQDIPFGFFNIHKPSGPTSHDIIAGVRKGLQMRRVGHAGTLDPLAEGVLVVAVGEATRLLEYLTVSEKTYIARVKLGVATDTYDAEGKPVATHKVPPELTTASIELHLAEFRGQISQVPPVYSSVKVKGKTAHARVRAGEAVELQPRHVEIYELRLVEYLPPVATLYVRCTAGTYIRSLAHDLGAEIGCGAHLAGLVRQTSGQFSLDGAVTWADFQSAFEDGSWSEHLLSPEMCLGHLPRVDLTVEQAEDIRHGRRIAAGDNLGTVAAAYLDERFVAVLVGDFDTAQWKPKKVFLSRMNEA